MIPSARPSMARKSGAIGAITSTMALPMVKTSKRASATGKTPGRLGKPGAGIADCGSRCKRKRRVSAPLSPSPLWGGWRGSAGWGSNAHRPEPPPPDPFGATLAVKGEGESHAPTFRSLVSHPRRRNRRALGGFRRRRLRFEPAPLGDDAVIALGDARLADVAAVEDQPVMGVEQVFFRHHLEQSLLHLDRRLAGREAGAVADAEEVRVDGDRWLPIGDVEHDVRGLPADA